MARCASSCSRPSSPRCSRRRASGRIDPPSHTGALIPASAAPDIVKHKQTNLRGQIAVQTPRIDLGNQLGECALFCTRDLLELSPKGVLEANARFMSADNNGTFFDCRLHRPMPPASVSDRGVN